MLKSLRIKLPPVQCPYYWILVVKGKKLMCTLVYLLLKLCKFWILKFENTGLFEINKHLKKMGPSSVVTVAPLPLILCVPNWGHGFSSFS
jgi:hypothetical protein